MYTSLLRSQCSSRKSVSAGPDSGGSGEKFRRPAFPADLAGSGWTNNEGIDVRQDRNENPPVLVDVPESPLYSQSTSRSGSGVNRGT